MGVWLLFTDPRDLDVFGLTFLRFSPFATPHAVGFG